MRKQKIYLETTIFNYYFDTTKNAQPVTVAFFETLSSGQFEGYTSEYAYTELDKALDPRRSNMLLLIDKYHITMLDSSEEVFDYEFDD